MVRTPPAPVPLAVPSAVLALVAALAACSDDAPADPDAATDAPTDVAIDGPDAAGCGADYQMTGEYVDWESTSGVDFDGVEEAVWTVIGDAGRTATTAPNGRIIICLPRTTVTLTVNHTPAQGGPLYVPALFVADPAVLSPAGAMFSARGLRRADADDRYGEIQAGMTFDASAGHVLVVKRGAPTALAIGASPSFVSAGVDDPTWEPGDTGTFTLFPNLAGVPAGGAGTVTLTGTFTGPTTIPVDQGKLTIVPIS
ncbi:MAG: hypothetical protein HS111_05885 [Kofleriaceae bacterium]|nr:hypothetical protein [Kofleriaceae bacterium]MCL4225706.1 hypothetical protein [Myxococcales bacterium]